MTHPPEPQTEPLPPQQAAGSGTSAAAQSPHTLADRTVNPRSKRGIVFLRDVLGFSFRAFGGPQAHVIMLERLMVQRRGYLTSDELFELYALCQLLPGPSSTQLVVAIGYKRGGPLLAFFTLLLWLLPATLIMTGVGMLQVYVGDKGAWQGISRFLTPLALGFVAFAAYRISRAVCKVPIDWAIMAVSTVVAVWARSPFAFPVLMLAGGLASHWAKVGHLRFRRPQRFKIRYSNLLLWIGIFLASAILGSLTRERPVLLFENMYRYGSLVFGGGQVLVPLLHEQLVTYKQLVRSDDFLTGYSLAQAVPGPVFGFVAYLGVLAMAPTGWGVPGMLLGAAVCTVGIFLPGTLLIFFLFPMWKQIAGIPWVRPVLDGITAVSAGLVVAAALYLVPAVYEANWKMALAAGTFALLHLTKVAPYVLVLAAVLAGLVLPL